MKRKNSNKKFLKKENETDYLIRRMIRTRRQFFLSDSLNSIIFADRVPGSDSGTIIHEKNRYR